MVLQSSEAYPVFGKPAPTYTHEEETYSVSYCYGDGCSSMQMMRPTPTRIIATPQPPNHYKVGNYNLNPLHRDRENHNNKYHDYVADNHYETKNHRYKNDSAGSVDHEYKYPSGMTGVYGGAYHDQDSRHHKIPVGGNRYETNESIKYFGEGRDRRPYYYQQETKNMDAWAFKNLDD